jgi:hypothetical protein
MKFSEVVEELHSAGHSEEKALKRMIDRVQAAGGEWTPTKMELFYKVWSHLAKTDDNPTDVDETTTAPVTGKPTKVFPMDKFKQKHKTVVPAPVVPTTPAKKAFPINKIKNKVTDTPSVKTTPSPLKTVNGKLPAGNAGAFTAFLTFALSTIAWLHGKKMSTVRDVLAENKSTLDAFIKQIGMESKNYAKITELILDAKKYGDQRAVNVVGFGNAIKAVFPVFESREYHFPTDKLNLLKQLGAFFISKKRSENQYKNIVNKAGTVGVSALSALFASDVEARLPKVNTAELTALYDRWYALNKKLGGNKYNVRPIPADPPKEYDKKGKLIPPVKKEKSKIELEYTELNNTLKKRYKDLIKAIVYSGGERLPGSNHTTMDVEDVKAQLAAVGMKWSAIPVGFVGRINDAAQLCTSQGWTIGNPLGGVVRMHKTYDPVTGFGGYCSGIRPDRIHPDGTRTPGKSQRCFSEKHTNPGGYRDAKKIGAVDDFLEHELSYRKKWFNVIKAGIAEVEAVEKNGGTGGLSDIKTSLFTHAVMLEAMYQLAPRPGSDESGGENTHFTEPTKGFTYLLKKDVKMDKNKIIFDFYDKNGRQILTLTKVGRGEPDPQSSTDAKILFNAIKYFYDSAPNEDAFLWTEPNGKNVKYSAMTAYIRSIVPAPFGLHKFRHVKATKIAMSILDSCPLKIGQTNSKELSEFYLKAMEAVGKELGHRNKDIVSSTQAIKSYVSKTVSRHLFERYGVKETPGIAKSINEAEESSSREFTVVVGPAKKKKK